MKSWRLNWIMSEIRDISNVYKHRQALYYSYKFWASLLLKFIPYIWPFTIKLHLRPIGVIEVKEFMTLYIYKEIFVDGCYDQPILASSEPIIIDIGANTGLFMIRMKQLYPKSKVFCYEPFPPNYYQLKRNVLLSRLENVEIFKMGVGGTEREEKLYVHRKNIGGHSIYKNQTGGSKFVEIKLIDVKNVLSSLEGKNCDLMKIDVEGAELEIIKSISPEISKRIENILIETTPSLYDVKGLIQHLEDIGYRVFKQRGMFLAIRKT